MTCRGGYSLLTLYALCSPVYAIDLYGLLEAERAYYQRSSATAGSKGFGEEYKQLLVFSESNIPYANSSISYSAYIQGAACDSGTKCHNSAKLTELYLESNIGDSMFIEIGKKKVLSGTAFFRSPSDFLFSDEDFIKQQVASAFNVVREGVVGVGIGYQDENFSIYNYFSPEVSSDSHKYIDDYITSKQKHWQNLTKLSYQLGVADISFVYYATEDDNKATHYRYALNYVSFLTSNLEIHVDSVLVERDTRLVLEGGKLHAEEVEWFIQATAGIGWTFSQNLSVIAEFYYNEYGLKDQEYDQFIALNNNDTFFKGGGVHHATSYGAFNLATYYAMQRLIYTDDFNKYSVELFNVTNITDRGGIANISVSLSLFDSFKAGAKVSRYYGDSLSEARLANDELHLSTFMEFYF